MRGIIAPHFAWKIWNYMKRYGIVSYIVKSGKSVVVEPKN